MVHLLLERRADINARSTGHPYTGLVAACDRKNEGLVHLILSHGADVNAWDEEHGEW